MEAELEELTKLPHGFAPKGFTENGRRTETRQDELVDALHMNCVAAPRLFFLG